MYVCLSVCPRALLVLKSSWKQIISVSRLSFSFSSFSALSFSPLNASIRISKSLRPFSIITCYAREIERGELGGIWNSLKFNPNILRWWTTSVEWASHRGLCNFGNDANIRNERFICTFRRRFLSSFLCLDTAARCRVRWPRLRTHQNAPSHHLDSLASSSSNLDLVPHLITGFPPGHFPLLHSTFFLLCSCTG